MAFFLFPPFHSNGSQRKLVPAPKCSTILRWARTAERRNASERRRAAAEAKRAEAERKAIADAQKIVAIWNARQAGGRALWFYPTIGAAIAAGSLAHLLLPRVPASRLDRSAHARPTSGRGDLQLDPFDLLPPVLT